MIDKFDQRSVVEYLSATTVTEDLSNNNEKVYRSEQGSVFFTKVSDDQKNYKYLYAVTEIEEDWDDYKKQTIAEVSKRIGEFFKIAQAQENLVFSEARYRSLFENIL